MGLKYNLGDKVILDGLKGYWEIVRIISCPDSTKKYVLQVKADHKYKHAESADLICCEKTLKRLTSKD